MSDKFPRFLPAIFAVALVAGCTSTDTENVLNPRGQTAVDAATQSQVVQGKCPAVALREGTAYFSTYAKGGEKDKDPSKVMQQASIADTTRQCRVSGDQMIMTVVASGRLVAGPAGGAGSVELPVRVVVLEGETVLYSELQRQAVTLPEGTLTTQFVVTNSEVTFPAASAGSARVFIGFDPGPYNTK
ncbi:hypothetical protein DFR52_102553 [Hoeflea marina]|uniref:Lipoprotein n=1 Tax=Hoeflea marina TaxID=274592 RepID=A0A317PNU3_9HYPH|nr:hypothetical protein [Hoeflea marina]PWW01889.1 hypothetical protein DFR52_102553 [Hoeflea marina]